MELGKLSLQMVLYSAAQTVIFELSKRCCCGSCGNCHLGIYSTKNVICAVDVTLNFILIVPGYFTMLRPA